VSAEPGVGDHGFDRRRGPGYRAPVQQNAASVDVGQVAISERPGPRLVTTGRTTTIVSTCLALALLAWALRPVVSLLSADHVLLHHVALGDRLFAFIFVSAALIGCLVVVCLNRVLLHAVAWCTAGATANLGELVLTGSVADYVPIGDHRLSAGDVYVSVGIMLLALGALKVVFDGRTR